MCACLIQVHIYNVPSLPPFGTTLEYLKSAQALFPEGQALAVLEPFYKLMLDGTYGVRVDNPAEVSVTQRQTSPCEPFQECRSLTTRR
jgi:hypothetical protein